MSNVHRIGRATVEWFLASKIWHVAVIDSQERVDCAAENDQIKQNSKNETNSMNYFVEGNATYG